MLTDISFWHWFGLATIFFVLEMLLPGAFMLWIGAAAGVVGLVVLMFPALDWEWQILVFSLLAILTVSASRRYLAKTRIESEDPDLNHRTSRYRGQIVTLESAIENGRGRAPVGDTVWTVTGPDLPAGSKVKIVGSEGAVLKVEKL